jgi:predicted small metal-binding protein
MTTETLEETTVDQSDSQVELKDEESYREYLCRDIYKGKECGFRVLAKTDDEVIEHARMHQEIAHSVSKVSPDMIEKIKANITPASADGHQF